jgi:hypothetical protein
MTLRYAHLAPSHKVNAMSVLDETINERPTIQKIYSGETMNLPAASSRVSEDKTAVLTKKCFPLQQASGNYQVKYS